MPEWRRRRGITCGAQGSWLAPFRLGMRLARRPGLRPMLHDFGQSEEASGTIGGEASILADASPAHSRESGIQRPTARFDLWPGPALRDSRDYRAAATLTRLPI